MTYVSPGPRSIRADVVVSFQRNGGEQNQLEGYLEAVRPDRMRLRTHLGLIQAFELTSRGDSFWVSIPHYDALIGGRKSEVRLTPLDPARLAQALFLRVSEADSVSGLLAEQDSASGWFRSVPDTSGWIRLHLDSSGRPVRFLGYRASGEPAVEIEWSRYAGVEGGEYPRRITWRDLKLQQSMEFEFDGTRLNADLENNRFEPNPHSDWKVIPWTSWQDMFGP